MSTTQQLERAELLWSDYKNKLSVYGENALLFAYHAALPVALTPELLHLIRINFFLDPPDEAEDNWTPLPYWIEFDFLVSSICHQVDDGLYEIEPTVRDILLEKLVLTYKHTERIQEIASLLWQYTTDHLDWEDREGLERAQQLTALNFLAPDKALEWLETAETQDSEGEELEREWYVVMRQGVEKHNEILISSEDNKESQDGFWETELLPIKVYLSYARQDEALAEEFKVHLTELEEQENIRLWDYRSIDAGENWKARIHTELDSSNVFLVLVSSSYFASDFCVDEELKRALKRREQGDCQVIPIYLKPTFIKGTPVASLHRVPSDGRAVTEWENKDNAFADAVRGIRRLISHTPAEDISEILFYSPDHLPKPPIIEPLSTFILYSQKDERLKEDLERHLTVLKNAGSITFPSEINTPVIPIDSYQAWDERTINTLESTSLILPLLSPNFYDFEFYESEIFDTVIDRYNQGQCQIVPILGRPVKRGSPMLNDFQILPSNNTPVTRWDDEDLAFTSVVNDLDEIARRFDSQKKSQVKRVRSKALFLLLDIPPESLTSSLSKREITQFVKERASRQVKLKKIIRDFRKFLGHDNFALAIQNVSRQRDIASALSNEAPNFVHIFGYGNGGGQIGQMSLVSNQDELVAITPNELSDLFKPLSNQLEFVVLDGCHSRGQAEAIAESVPYVVSISSDDDDNTSTEFAVSFYDALGAGRSVEFAFELGRNAIELSGRSDGLSLVLIKQGQKAPPVARKQTVNVFIAYSHKDENLYQQLAAHLATLERQGYISAWHDRKIMPGVEWNNEISTYLERADLILLLVSANFLASDYCWNIEIDRAIQRHDDGDAVVVPIILKPCDWVEAPFNRLQAMPRNARPVTQWNDPNEAFVDIAKGIRRVVGSLAPSEPDDNDDAWDTPPPSEKPSPAERLELVRALQDLPPAQFDELVFALELPTDVLPDQATSFPQRIIALLSFAESAAGPGLAEVRRGLDIVAGNTAIQSERTGGSAAPLHQRIELLRTLTDLLSAQFDELVYALDPPAGVLPDQDAPLQQRALALLEWAESPIGPGLAEVRRGLDIVAGNTAIQSERTGGSAAPLHQRIELLRTLTDLPPAQFDELQFVLNAPAGVLPWRDAASVRIRAAALLQWAESTAGPGIIEIRRVLDEIVGSTTSTGSETFTQSKGTDASASAPPQRLELLRPLTNLPAPQFDALVFALNPPAGIVADQSASALNRAGTLLDWAQSDAGPGLAEVKRVLEEDILGDNRKESVGRGPATRQPRYLLDTLTSLSAAQFDHIVFTLNPPQGTMPPSSVSQAERAPALLSWAESSTGCGLEQVNRVLDEFLNPTPANNNPFGNRGRISEAQQFFGRQALLQQIFEELRQGTSVSLVGDAGTGKSSILAMICRRGPDELSLEPEHFIYIDMQSISNEGKFFEALCEKLGFDQPLRGFSLARKLQGQRYILCLDEIERIANWQSFTADEYEELRALADGADAPFTLVVASRSPLDVVFDDDNVSTRTSPLHSLFNISLCVKAFTLQETIDFLNIQLQGSAIQFSVYDKSALYDQTQGNPARLQAAAADLYRRQLTRS
jgi:hypothetical protein